MIEAHGLVKRVILGLGAPTQGSVTVGGRSCRYPPASMWLPQAGSSPWSLT
jgi:hypothetical protein